MARGARHRPTAPPSASAPGVGPIEGYGAIGNLRTAALVSRTGSIDWACLPFFSSPSVFGRLLDPERGGFHRVAPPEYRESFQRYVPGTNVLRTYFLLGGGRRVVLTDFMPVAPAFVSASDARIVRRVEMEGGHGSVDVEIDPRFDFGRARAVRWEEHPDRLVARSGANRLRFPGPIAWDLDGPTAGASLELRSGVPVFLPIEWKEPSGPDDPEVVLASTVRFWRQWVENPDAPFLESAHIWRDWVERSALVLKLLSDRESGAFVAAPTTSLPEWPGGVRNWDYRFAWIRDAAFTAQAFILLGHLREAREYVRWVLQRLGPTADPRHLRILYDVSGGPAAAEEELDHWAGYEGSRPVRIGNAAKEQAQHDIFGEVLDAVGQLREHDAEFVRAAWPAISRLVTTAQHVWREPDAGIWESRRAPAHYVHSKVMCWVALDRGISIARDLGLPGPIARWRSTAEAIRRSVLRNGFDPSMGAFVQAYDRPRLDASTLRIPLVGFLPFEDERVRSTVRAVERHLSRGPFVWRYDGSSSQHGVEGSFLLCAFWLVECLARSGERDRALRSFRRLLRAAGPLRLFAEEYDPAAGRLLGNYPQAFTHIGVLRAAFALGVEPPAA